MKRQVSEAESLRWTAISGMLQTAQPTFQRDGISPQNIGRQKSISAPARSGTQTSDLQDIPPLDKIPTNEFIEKFLDDDNHSTLSTEPTEMNKSRKSTKAKIEPLPELDDDDLETVLDIKEVYIPYDDTGQRAYENACKKYKALASTTFYKKLADSSDIDMRHYGTGPQGGKALSIPLVINTKVTTLNLSGNNLSKDGMSYVAKMMGENSFISELDLSDNDIRSHGAILVAEMLKDNNNLTRLVLSGNKFADDDAFVLAKSLQDHASLKILDLSNNEFGDRSGAAFRTIISENDNMTDLDLSWNHIRMRGGIEIAKGVKDGVCLKVLNLSWNGLGDDGAKEMATALKSCSLSTLDLTCNRVQSEGFLSLVKSLKDTDTLKCLKVGRNPIPEEAAVAGLDFLFSVDEVNLEELDLGEIILGKIFKEKLKLLQEKHTELNVPFGYTDSYGKRKLKKYNVVEEALTAMKTYCDDHGIGIIELFSRFDEDGSMSVTHEEFKQGLRDAKIPLSALQIEELINALDQDGDGEIDFSELVLGAQMYD